MSLCSPALLYLIIAIISIISMIYSKVNMQTIAMKGLFVIIYTWFLNFLCSKGHEGISWFLVILPFVIMALFILYLSNIIGGKMGQNKEMFSNNCGVNCSGNPQYFTTANASCCCGVDCNSANLTEDQQKCCDKLGP